MHPSILMLIFCFFCLLLIFLLFLFKKKKRTVENKLYFYLLVTTMMGVLLDIIGIYAHINLSTDNVFRWLDVKLYLIFLLTFVFLVTIYILMVGSNKEVRVKFTTNKTLLVLSIFYGISFILNFLLPFDYFNDDGIVYVQGPNCIYLYTVSFLGIFFWVLFIFLKRKTIKKKKILPILLFAFFSIPIVLLQMSNPEFLLVTSLCTFIVIFMYFTIENPDIKMLEEVNIAKMHAEQANKAKSDFLSSMSHEIRTPLNAIVGFSECIKNEETLEDAKKDAEDIIMASSNLLEIVNGVLDISKIEANKMEIVNTNYKLLPNLDNLAKLMIPRIGDRPIELKTNFAPDIPNEMYGDIGKIKQIITNLLTNAVKYTEKGEINFNVSCINEDDICSLVIMVEDTGRGIKEDKIDGLFTKFNRLEEDRNTTIEGTGLGLAITKSLIEMMGGKIVVQSTYGVGSKFIVYLKQKITKLNSESEIKEEKEEENLEFKDTKVLVVDDNKLNLKVAEKLLKRYGLNVTLLDSGFEAIENIKQGNKYDLILLDDMMPKLRGTETLVKLKEIEGFNIPTIALTANALAGMKESYLRQGFSDYLSKPIDKIELGEMLKKYLNKDKSSNEIIKEDIVSEVPAEEPTVSEFKVEEEIEIPEMPKLNIDEEKEELKQEKAEEKNKKALVVDDNKLNIKVVTNFLKPYNLIIDSVLSGNDAIEKVKENNYNIIFMDDMMPGLNGVETFNELKKLDGFNTPVVALTANAVDGSREKYLKDGFCDYLAKPIDKNELDRIINTHLKEIESEQKDEVKEDKQDMTEYLKQSGVDVDKAIELLGDMDSYNDMLNEFFDGLGDRLTNIKENKEKENMAEYAVEVHALKSDSKYLGFTHLADISYNHELKAKENDIEYIKTNYKELMSEASRIALVVKNYLKK